MAGQSRRRLPCAHGAQNPAALHLLQNRQGGFEQKLTTFLQLGPRAVEMARHEHGVDWLVSFCQNPSEKNGDESTGANCHRRMPFHHEAKSRCRQHGQSQRLQRAGEINFSAPLLRQIAQKFFGSLRTHGDFLSATQRSNTNSKIAKIQKGKCRL